MSSPEKRPWFPAKKQGWGWGLPVTWQGWAVFVAYLVLTLAGALRIRDGLGVILFVVYALVLSAGFLAVCWLKGERPRWR